MKKPRIHPPVPIASEALTIRFVRQMPNEEVVFYARRCAQRTQQAGPLTIVLEAKPSAGHPVHEVRLEQDGRVLISETDPEIFLAVRNAFDRLEMEMMTIPAHLRGGRAAATLPEPSKLWS